MDTAVNPHRDGAQPFACPVCGSRVRLDELIVDQPVDDQCDQADRIQPIVAVCDACEVVYSEEVWRASKRS